MSKFTLTFFIAILSLQMIKAETLRFAGVLGNSGEAGSSLIRVNTFPKKKQRGSMNSGIYMDRNARVWLSGGDAINCIDIEGRLVKRYPLLPEGSRIDSKNFAILDNVLYAFGHLPKAKPKTRSDVALFALPLSGAENVKAVAEFAEYPSHRKGLLCSTPHDGKLVFCYSLEGKKKEKNENKKIIIASFDPKTKTRKPLLEIPGHWPAGIELDPDGKSFYLGGFFGKYKASNKHHANVCEIIKMNWDGKELWRRICLDTPAQPTQFRGVISLAAGSLWDIAWYGFLARFDRNGKTNPGKVASWDMRIHYLSQISDVRKSLNLLKPKGVAVNLDPLLLSNNRPENAYLATWDDVAGSLKLNKRYGSLPELGNIYLSPKGWVNINGFWWMFDDAANSAPRFANHAAPGTPGVWRDDWVCKIVTQRKKILPAVGRPAFGRDSEKKNSSSAVPFSQVKGFAVAKSNDPRKTMAFASEGQNNKIWRSTMDPRTWAPRKQWEELLAESITAPGDIAVLDDGSLIVVDNNSIVQLELAGNKLTEKKRLTSWGKKSNQKFGKNLRMAADRKFILVSDTDRQRVLLIDIESFKPIAQVGTTDQAGSGRNQFNSPGSVALSGSRAIVADVNNQRVIKLTVGKK